MTSALICHLPHMKIRGATAVTLSWRCSWAALLFWNAYLCVSRATSVFYTVWTLAGFLRSAATVLTLRCNLHAVCPVYAIRMWRRAKSGLIVRITFSLQCQKEEKRDCLAGEKIRIRTVLGPQNQRNSSSQLVWMFVPKIEIFSSAESCLCGSTNP